MTNINRSASIGIARDLALKLIERRAASPDQLAAGLKLLTLAADNLFLELQDGDGLWLVRLARDCTIKMIERNLIGSLETAALGLAENGRLMARIATGLDLETRAAAMNTARDLSLKFLETGRVSKSGWAELFQELAHSLALPSQSSQ